MNDLVLLEFKGVRQRKTRRMLLEKNEVEKYVDKVKKHFGAGAHIDVITDHNIVMYEPNKRPELHKTDCVIRAYTKFFDRDYEEVAKELRQAYRAGSYKNVKNVLFYLSRVEGLTLVRLKKGITLDKILEVHDDKKIIIIQRGHLVVAENGKLYDNGAQALGLMNEGIAIRDEDLNDYTLSLGEVVDYMDFYRVY